MPHDSKDRKYQENRDPAALLRTSEELLRSLFAESRAAEWGLTPPQFAAALERSLRKQFPEGPLSSEHFSQYLQALYLEDLALASACLEGSENAWEYFVREFRGYLRAAAGAITKGGRGGTDPRELADALFAELFGLVDGKRGERSLFRYFHGRSSLKTWLRTVLAQRHVDRIRESRRWKSLDAGDAQEPKLPAQLNVATPSLDPHRHLYLARFVSALEDSLAALHPSDHRRLELYYVRQQTLAEIGRSLGEHESSVSRNLDRCRRDLRARIEGHLRRPPSLSDAEIAVCFQYAAEDVPIDFRNLFPDEKPGRPGAGRKESS